LDFASANSLEGIVSVKMGANPQGHQELQVRGWTQLAVDSALHVVNAKIQSVFVREQQAATIVKI
jgi:hypothetical protein